MHCELQRAQAMMQQQAQGSDPNQAYLQAEQMKLQAKQQENMAKMQLDQQKAQADYQLDMQNMLMKDDMARDKMNQDLILQAAKLLGEHGIAVDEARIHAMQAAQRPINGRPQ